MGGISYDDDQVAPVPSPAPKSNVESNSGRTEQRGRDRDDDRDDGRGERQRVSLRRQLSRTVSRNGASESLTKAFKEFDEYIKNYPDDTDSGVINMQDYVVMRVERSEHRLDLSSLIFVQPIETTTKKFAVYYTLLLAGSNTSLVPLRDRNEGRRNRRYRDRDDRGRGEIPRTPGDVYDDRYSDVVAELVSKRFPGFNLIEAGTSVLGAKINLEKDRQVLENHFFFINAAIETEVSIRTEEQEPFSMNWLTADDDLVLNVDWNPAIQYDVNNQPVAADVLIESVATIDDEDDGAYTDNLTRVAGYLDLVYSPSSQQRGFGARRSRDDDNTQLVTPKFTISVADTNYPAVTPELIALGISTAAPLSDNLEWTRPFTEPYNGDGIDYKDISNLNVLVSDSSKPFDVTDPKLSYDDRMEYFGTLCRPDLAYALDVPMAGENSWALEDYTLAASGDKEALDRIMKTFDNLYDNNFTPIFKDIVSSSGADRNPFVLGDLIMNGDYRDGRDSDIRDLREIGFLWWLNRTGAKDQGDSALEWSDTMDLDSGSDESEAIEKRLRMVQNVLGTSNVNVTGYSRQVLIDISLFQACAEAAAACDVNIVAANNNNQRIDRRGRGNRRIVSLAGSDAGSKMFSNRKRRSRRDESDYDDDSRGHGRRRRR